MALKTKIFDAAAYLDTEEAIGEFLAAASESGDPGHIERAHAVADRARAMHGLVQVGR